MNVIPVFKSKRGDVSRLKYVDGIGSLFVVTDENVIYRVDEFPLDAIGRGLTGAYAEINSGEGDFSPVVSTRFYYDLYRSVVHLDGETQDFTVVINEVAAYAVNENTKVTAVYVSDVLKADEDFGFWKTITWRQTVTDGRVIVALKVSETETELLESGWQYYIEEIPESTYTTSTGSTHVVLKDLDRFNLKGRFMQFKVELETDSRIQIPVVSEFVITYASKHAVFFFTRKFKVERGSNIDNILITANYTLPTNTELRFGVVNSNSGDWEDYRIVDMNRLASLPGDWGNIVKVGVKMSSYSETAYPTVQEIALLLGTDTDNGLNE